MSCLMFLLNDSQKKLAFYCICGGTGLITDFLIFTVLVYLGVHYQISNTMGYATGTIVSFFLNRAITFNVLDKMLTRLFLFFCVATIGYLGSLLLLWILVELISMEPVSSKLVSLPIIVIIQFSLNKLVTFRY